MQSILTPAGTDAAAIEGLWWLLLGISVVVFVAVMAFLLYGIFAHRDHTAESERTKTRVVAVAAVATAVILVGILVATVTVSRATTHAGPDGALTIEVIGHQWWWEIRYRGGSADQLVVSANEVHVPVGERIRFVVRSQDVIHSLWLPNLGGKIDMFPDRENTIWLEATQAGVFRGQCAEFCGIQHGKMAFMVVAHERADFDAWLDRERMSAAPPADDLARRGHEAFVNGTCATCHRIRGTDALATFGPDLTHIGSRRTIAAGTAPNTRARMTAWIVDPQQLKPGAFMPATHMEPEALHAIVYYLEQLR
jgi:cytochrome c oxidase subunit II